MKAKQLDDGVGDTLVAVDAAGGAQKRKLLARNSVAPDRPQTVTNTKVLWTFALRVEHPLVRDCRQEWT